MVQIACRELASTDQDSLNSLLEARSVPIRQANARRYGAFQADVLIAVAGIGKSDKGGVVLFDLYVSPTERGKGVGSALVAWLKDNVRAQASSIFLTVRRDNYVAVKLYRTSGFKVTCRQGEQYEMVCNLGNT